MDCKRVISLIILSTLTVACLGNLENHLDSDIESFPNEYVVKLATETLDAKRDFITKANEDNQLFELVAVTEIGKYTVALLRTQNTLENSEVIDRVREQFGDKISYIINNLIINATSSCDPNGDAQTCNEDRVKSSLWGLDRIAHEELSRSDFTYRWSDKDGGSGVTVYVVDSGVYLDHEQFSNIETKWGFTGPQVRSKEHSQMDLNGHGTHVAGTAVGKDFGVAKKSRLVAVKVLDREGVGSLFDILAGIRFVVMDFENDWSRAGHKPKVVVNLSLGAPGKCSLLDEALTQGSKMGIIFVAAAGNEAEDACGSWPSYSDETITVGATNDKDGIAWFSNYGKCVDILAPGQDILSAGTSDRSAQKTLDGTSMAAPFVSGVIARYLSALGDDANDVIIDVKCVKQYLLSTATKGKASIPRKQQPMPNEILFVGCNTCFSQETCAENRFMTLKDLLSQGVDEEESNGSTMWSLNALVLVLVSFIYLF